MIHFHIRTDPVSKSQEKVDRKRDGKTILRSGKGWGLLVHLGQLKTGLGGNVCANCIVLRI